MKKWICAAAPAALSLLPQRAFAQSAALPARQTIMGADRVLACWILAVCSVAFVALICVWSVGLRRKAAQNRLMQTHSPRERK